MGDAGAVFALAWVQTAGLGKGLVSHWYQGNPMGVLHSLGAPSIWLTKAGVRAS